MWTSLNKLSLRWKLMLSPVLGIVLLTLLTSLFFFTISSQEQTLERIQKGSLKTSQALSQLATRLAKNHVRLHELLSISNQGVDESNLYEVGKPLLNEVHSIEAEVKLIARKITSSGLLQTALMGYRQRVITAVEMAIVDFGLAHKYLRQATRHFNQTNSQFLLLQGATQQVLENQLREHDFQVYNILRNFGVLVFVIIVAIVIMSLVLAKLLSRDLNQSIQTLGKVAVIGEEKIEATNEIDQLTQAIENVKYRHQRLETTREELSQQKSQLRAILDNMLDSVITIDESGTILTFNKAAESLFAYPAVDIIGKNVSCLMPESYARQHDGFLRRYIDTGEARIIGSSREVIAKKRNMVCFPMLLSIVESPYRVDGKRCFIGSCHDLTKIKQQEEQLRKAQKMEALGKLTGGIAHDYNNLLAIIQGYSELLAVQLSHDAKLNKYTQEIQQAANRGAHLTKKLLVFSRQKTSQATTLNISAFLQAQKLSLQKTLTARINLVLDLAEDLWPVELESGDLQDAIVNLCVNAMNAMASGGELTLRTSNESVQEMNAKLLRIAEGDYVLLSVTDTGCGMDEETKEKIFDPFFTRTGELGTGLGLSQVYGFVERCGGTIKVYSKLGQGSRFTLYFPRNHQVVLATPDIEIGEAMTKGGNESLLVVDDEQAILDLAYDTLSAQSYRVHTANDGQQALKILAQENVDLVISDVIMPNMDGYQLSAQIRQRHPQVKILLVSGFADNNNKSKVDEELCQNILHKPYTSETLLIRVRSMLDNSQNNTLTARTTP